MSKSVGTKILLRNDTAANWTANNPVLAKGQIGIQINTKKFKFGDGTTAWNSLDYGAGADIATASASADGLMSANDFTKLAGIMAGAQPNEIEVIKKNGVTQTITNKTVNITVPTATSDLTNDSGFITISDVPEGAAASTTVPLMNGTAATGSETAFARGDHVHPSDTSKVDKVTGKGLSTNDYTTEQKTKLAGIEAGAEVSFVKDIQISPKGEIPASYVNPNASEGDTIIISYEITDKNDNNYTFVTEDGMGAVMSAMQQSLAQIVSTVFKYLGTKATVSALPASHNTIGDVWHVTQNGSEYAWDGSAWQELGSTIDLSNYIQSVNIAGISITPSSYTITAAQLQSALGLGAAAYKGVDTSITAGSTSVNLPTAAAVASYVTNNSTKVESSTTNGNIKVNNSEVTVYTLPSTTLDSSDTLILDCGSSSSNYS